MPRQKRQFMRQGVADLPTRAAVDAYVGAPGEPIFDNERLRIHDGETAGGIRLTSQDDLASAVAAISTGNSQFETLFTALMSAWEQGLPITDTGLTVGQWWSNGGIPTRVKVVS